MRPFPVTRRGYRDRWCRPIPPRAGTLRRRQLAALVDAYGVADARPATAGDHDNAVPTRTVVAGRPIEGDPLWPLSD